jgi:hypothetical protein
MVIESNSVSDEILGLSGLTEISKKSIEMWKIYF